MSSPLIVHRFTDGVAFAAAVTPCLLQNEVMNNFLFRLVTRFADGSTPVPANVYLAAAYASDLMIGVAAVRPLPPTSQQLLLSHPIEGVAIRALLADAVQSCCLSGVNAPADAAAEAAAHWTSLTGGTIVPVMSLRVHELRRLELVPGVGELRPVMASVDGAVVTSWISAFMAECFPATAAVQHNMSLDGFHVWVVDGEPVTMARGLTSGPQSAAIGMVYTPPDHRRKGYATSAVTALSQLLLDRGCSMCVLFTDVTNATSNAVYHRIGYRPLGDFSDLAFRHSVVSVDE